MYKIIACNIFKREIENLIHKDRKEDVIFVEQGLHNTPSKMREKIQMIVDEIESHGNIVKNYKGIVLLYGVCGNGTLGLKTSKLKLVVPKAHDCMTLFLGSKEKYKEIIDKNNGVYWFNHAWIDQTPMPSEAYLKDVKKAYYENYDEDNAEYLYEIEVESLKRYNYGLLIKSNLNDGSRYKEFVMRSCEEFNWKYIEEDGDLRIINNILRGEFYENEVLVLNPGEVIKMTLDKEILMAEKCI